jgi:uncharacterized protein (DUF934 family)
MQIIKDREIVEDNWLHLDDDAELVAGNVTVSKARWLSDKDSLVKHDGQLGLRLKNDDSLQEIAADLKYFSLVALNFPAFTDGRSYSLARLLRDRYDYQGEIRAQGDILHDQLFYLTQCGFTSFEMVNENRLVQAIAAFDDFSESYQTTVVRPEPLYRRR